MDKEKTCCITGPFPQNLPFGYDESAKKCKALKTAIRKEIENQINEHGITNFITSVNIGVELFAAEEALKLKEKYPQITIISVLPFEAQAAEWPEKLRDRYFCVLEKCDTVHTVQARYDDLCNYNTREYLIDRSSVLIAFPTGAHGETEAMMEAANRKGNELIIIYPHTL